MKNIREEKITPNKEQKENELSGGFNNQKNGSKQQTENTSIKLFQTIRIQDQEYDFYEQEIIKQLELLEQQIETIFIKEDSFKRVSIRLESGYSKNIELFDKLHQLKKQNTINHCKRLIKYGSRVRDTKNNTKNGGYNDVESIELDEKDIGEIIHHLRTQNIHISTLAIDEETLMTKIKNGYKSKQKQYLLGNITPGNGIYGFSERYSTKLEGIVSINDETKKIRQQEAEEEFIKEATNLINNILTNFPIETYNDTNAIIEVLKKIEHISKNIHEKNKVSINNTIGITLQTWIAILIDKIINKEKIHKVENYKHIFMLKYTYFIDTMSTQIDLLQSYLERIDPEKGRETGRRDLREQYISEYKNYFRESFIAKRLKQTYNGDLSNTEAIKEKAITDIKEVFYKSMIKQGIIQKNDQTNNGIIKKDTEGKQGYVNAMKRLKSSFLQTGHALLLKHLYPDNKERRSLRQEYTQIITTELLQEINEHLTNKETFKLEEYYIRRQINHVYKQYGGTEELLNNEQEIDQIVNSHSKDVFIPKGLEIIHRAEKNLNQKDTIEPKHLYEPISDFVRYISRYLDFFLEEKIGKNNTSMSQTRERLPDALIDDISFLKKEIEIFHNHLEEEQIQGIRILYQSMEPHRLAILEHIIQKRFTQNAQAGSKLQRITIDHIAQNQGSKILDFFENDLHRIILDDLRGPIYGINLLESDEQKIKKYIQNYVQQFSQNGKIDGGISLKIK